MLVLVNLVGKTRFDTNTIKNHFKIMNDARRTTFTKNYKKGLTENRTRITGFKDRYDNHYTMKPCYDL